MRQNECEEIAESLAATPLAVQRLTEGLSVIDIRCKPEGGEFSVVENVCHLRDIEEDGYTVRIKRILDEDRPILTDIDGSKLSLERDYDGQDLTQALVAFARARENNVRTIRTLSAHHLVRPGMLENTGEITLGRLLELMLEHDAAHIRELGGLAEKFAQRS